jgi:hypothetical protein
MRRKKSVGVNRDYQKAEMEHQLPKRAVIYATNQEKRETTSPD